MSATRATIEIPIATHRRLRSFAQREGYRMNALVARGLSRFLDEVELHNAAPVPNEPKRSPSRVAEISPSSVVSAADEAPTSSSLGGPDARLSASSVTVKEVPTASEREA